MEQFVLGADIGSGSVKLTLLSRTGKVAGTAGCEYPTYYPKTGWCEQEPEDWCTAFKTALQTLLAQTGVKPESIRAIAPDAATHTAVLLDGQGRCVRRAILWTDQRSREQVKFLRENHLEQIRKECLNTPTTVWTLPQLLWLQEQEPQVWEKTAHILFAKDYLRYRLTGKMQTDHVDAAGSMFYDVQKNAWSEELCAIANIKPEQLPEVTEPAALAGQVTREAAEEFGLAAGTQVLTGTTDTAVEILAAGNTQPGHATVKLATAGRICVICPKKLDSEYIFNYQYVIPGLWYPGTGTASCANSYRWYRDTIGKAPFEALNEPAEQIPAGSDGLMFHPYLNGELTPYNDPELRGSYTGISAKHTTAHFTRATLEGVAFSLRDCMQVLQQLDVTMERVRIIGGGAKGLLWRQIVADVLGLTMEKVKVDDSSFGSAMLAAVGIGWFESFTQAAEVCVEVESVTDPDPEKCKVYDALFPRYKAIHDALAPIYHG